MPEQPEAGKPTPESIVEQNEKAARAWAEAERVAREVAEAKRIDREIAEAKRIADERAEADRIARAQAEEDRLKRVIAEADRVSRAAEQHIPPTNGNGNGVSGLRNYLWHVTVIFVGFLLGILWSISWNQTTKNSDQIQSVMQRQAVEDEKLNTTEKRQDMLELRLREIEQKLDSIDRKLPPVKQ